MNFEYSLVRFGSQREHRDPTPGWYFWLGPQAEDVITDRVTRRMQETAAGLPARPWRTHFGPQAEAADFGWLWGG